MARNVGLWLDPNGPLSTHQPSKIDHDIAPGLRAADQHIAVRWRLDRVWPVADGAGDERGLAIMADSGTTRPSHGDAARLG